jgi:hypothetical protein
LVSEIDVVLPFTLLEPSLIEKGPYGKKNFFVSISLAQKYESPGFQYNFR